MRPESRKFPNGTEWSIFLLLCAAIFFVAPLWQPLLLELKGHNLFLTLDSMLLLGGAILCGLFCLWFVTDRLLDTFEKLMKLIRSRFAIFAVLFLALLLGGLLWINRHILHSFMNSADEHSCWFLAECFRMKRWWVEIHPLSQFFNVVHVGNRDGKWFSVYPFGWPLIMALGIQWNVLDWLNPVMTVLSVVMLFKVGEKIFGFTASWVGIFLAVLTPFFVFTAASYYSHSTSLFMMAFFSYTYLKWTEARTEFARVLWASLMACAIGYGLATRYLTQFAFVLPFMIYEFWPIVTRREKMRRDHFWALFIVAIFLFLVYYQNFMVTGKFHKAPNRYDKGWERLGFRDFYTPIDGIVFILARFFYLMDWAPPMFLVLFFASLIHANGTARQKLFRYSFLYLVVAYFFYFSWGGNQYGPRYYYEGFPFLALAMADGLRRLWIKNGNELKSFLMGVVIFSLATSGYQVLKQARYLDEVSSQRKALYDFAEETLKKPSIVFIRGFIGQTLVMSEDDAVRNSPRLDSRILYAHDLKESNQKLRKYFPDREFYLGIYDRKKLEAKLEKIP